jgi:hypothetical protein
MIAKKHLPLNRPLVSRTDLWFWMLLIVGNILRFIPRWLFLEPSGVFSVNFEFTLSVILVVVVGWRWRRNARNFFWGIFLFFFYTAIIYKSYAGILQGMYQLEPNFYNDIPFIANGLPFLLSALDVPRAAYVAFVLGVLLLFSFIAYVTHTLFVHRVETVGRITSIAMIALGAVLVLYGGAGLRTNAELPTGVDSLSNEISLNLSASRTSQENMTAFLAQDPYKAYDYVHYSLAERPNIYLLFFESYGSVLYLRDDFKVAYTKMLTDFEADLSDDGWHAVSALSTAPTWGGGSWMSYTSALFGLNVAEESEYLALRDVYQNIPYPNMGRYFHAQGYEYVWVVPINRTLSEEYLAAEHAFYGADRWVTYNTLNYDGPLYGWGPSPPDQYTFGYIADLVHAADQPTFIIYLNQDSHYPWAPLPERVDDWHSLATSDMEDGSLHVEENRHVPVFMARENYADAVAHSFENIADFITRLDDPNAIIVLLGDHQPPSVSRRDDGFATMLHIISRDTDFLTNFESFGFEKGLLLDTRNAQLAHEGFYSLFVRNFLAIYGSEPNDLPPYLAQGLN